MNDIIPCLFHFPFYYLPLTVANAKYIGDTFMGPWGWGLGLVRERGSEWHVRVCRQAHICSVWISCFGGIYMANTHIHSYTTLSQSFANSKWHYYSEISICTVRRAPFAHIHTRFTRYRNSSVHQQHALACAASLYELMFSDVPDDCASAVWIGHANTHQTLSRNVHISVSTMSVRLHVAIFTDFHRTPHTHSISKFCHCSWLIRWSAPTILLLWSSLMNSRSSPSHSSPGVLLLCGVPRTKQSPGREVPMTAAAHATKS